MSNPLEREQLTAKTPPRFRSLFVWYRTMIRVEQHGLALAPQSMGKMVLLISRTIQGASL